MFPVRIGLLETIQTSLRTIHRFFIFKNFKNRRILLKSESNQQRTVKPGYNALEGTGPRERYRRGSVMRGK